MQTDLADLLIKAVIGMSITAILLIIGALSENANDALKRDALNLSIPKTDDNDSEHRKTVFVMQRKSEILLVLWGITFLPAFSSPFLTTGILHDDIFDLLLFILTIIVVGLPAGIGRVLWNRSFWSQQLNPVKGIEERLEKHLAVQINRHPKTKPSRKWYSEVDMSIETNYETMMRLSLRRLLVELIWQRNASNDEREIILDYLSRREDLIGQISRDVQKSVQRAVPNP